MVEAGQDQRLLRLWSIQDYSRCSWELIRVQPLMGDNGLATPVHGGNGHSRNSRRKHVLVSLPESLVPTVAQTGMRMVLLAAVSVRAQNWEQPECPSIASQTNKPGCDSTRNMSKLDAWGNLGQLAWEQP